MKGGLYTPCKEIIESNPDEEEKKQEDSDDDEGFNDERDEDFSKKEGFKKKKEGEIVPKKQNLKNRFDETLSTVQEESEAEGTFA